MRPSPRRSISPATACAYAADVTALRSSVASLPPTDGERSDIRYIGSEKVWARRESRRAVAKLVGEANPPDAAIAVRAASRPGRASQPASCSHFRPESRVRLVSASTVGGGGSGVNPVWSVQ